MKIKTILVPTDFSETADHAVAQGADLALRFDASLHLYHVVEFHHAEPAVVATWGDFLDELEQDAQVSLRQKADVLRGNNIDVSYQTSRAFSPFEAIAGRAAELSPDLIVMGTHGRTGLSRLMMGSVAEKVLRHVPVNLLTLREKVPVVSAGHAFERILVPVDFSDFSKRAVEMAAQLLLPGGELSVAHVVATAIHPSFYAGGITQVFQIDTMLPRRIRERLEEWLGEQSVANLVVREGEIHHELENVRKEVDAQLIVMGTRGNTGLDHLLLGSVTEKMIRSAETSVLTVH